VFLALVSLIVMALICGPMGRAASMEAVSVAYAMIIQVHGVIDQHETDASESAAACAAVTF
jgi:hypothetical protein